MLSTSLNNSLSEVLAYRFGEGSPRGLVKPRCAQHVPTHLSHREIGFESRRFDLTGDQYATRVTVEGPDRITGRAEVDGV